MATVEMFDGGELVSSHESRVTVSGPRRRYRYADRGEAEDAQRREENRRLRAEWAMEGVIAGEVAWFKGVHSWVGRWGWTRFDGGAFILRSMFPGTGQKPSCLVFDEDGAKRLRQSNADYKDGESRELVRLIDQATAHR